MVAALALLLAAQVAAPAESVPVCTLVTPGGQAVGFFIGSDDAPNNIRLSATPGSIWPAATLRASRFGAGAGLRFSVGGERQGLVLELGSQPAGQTRRVATLFLRDHQRLTLPTAIGFCEDRPVNQEAPAPAADAGSGGADNAAFNPARWPDNDCALLLADGRRLRFRFTLNPQNLFRFESRDLWSGHTVTSSVRWQDSQDPIQRGVFGSQDGPEGLQMMFVDQSKGVKLFLFRQLRDPAMGNMTGYGICGLAGLVRRPVME